MGKLIPIQPVLPVADPEPVADVNGDDDISPNLESEGEEEQEEEGEEGEVEQEEDAEEEEEEEDEDLARGKGGDFWISFLVELMSISCSFLLVIVVVAGCATCFKHVRNLKPATQQLGACLRRGRKQQRLREDSGASAAAATEEGGGVRMSILERRARERMDDGSPPLRANPRPPTPTPTPAPTSSTTMAPSPSSSTTTLTPTPATTPIPLD